MSAPSDSTVVPLFILLFEADGEAERADIPVAGPCDALAALPSFLGELRGVAQAEAALEEIELLTVGYGSGGEADLDDGQGLSSTRIRLHGDGGDVAAVTSPESAVVRFPSLEGALITLGTWLLRHPEMNSPVVVLHVTGGRFRCCAEVERAAGTVKTACDVRGGPGVFYNVWLAGHGVCSFPTGEAVARDVDATAKTLFRMSSPIGAWGAEILTGLGYAALPAATRYFEVVPSVGASVVARFVGAFVAHGVKEALAGEDSGLDACAFLMPKEGDTLDKCEDVVSIHRTRRRFAISDGATTASYSAEWARALCRHAVECPPPVFPERALPLPEEEHGRGAEELKGWLEPVLEYWKPEVPWERLVRPCMYNKAKEGAGATLAGIEVLGEAGEAGVKFRAWALGDSCVIHLRGNHVVSARPLTCSAEFSHVPRLFMTQQGYEGKYIRFWQGWEATLAPGDTLLLGTDALCEYLLKSVESGAGEEVLGWLEGLSFGSRPEAWRSFEEFIEVKRKQGKIKNDDVGLILLKVRTNGE